MARKNGGKRRHVGSTDSAASNDSTTEEPQTIESRLETLERNFATINIKVKLFENKLDAFINKFNVSQDLCVKQFKDITESLQEIRNMLTNHNSSYNNNSDPDVSEPIFSAATREEVSKISQEYASINRSSNNYSIKSINTDTITDILLKATMRKRSKCSPDDLVKAYVEGIDRNHISEIRKTFQAIGILSSE